MPLLIVQPHPTPSPAAAMVLIAPRRLSVAVAATLVSQDRFGNTTIVTVSSTLSGTVYYYWYLDGLFVARSGNPQFSFVLSPGDFARVDCLASNDPALDTAANAPTQFPARRMLVFTRSLVASIARYRIEQQANGGAWTVIGFLSDDPLRWEYAFLTPRLIDLANYAWRVVPLDDAGDAGTPITLPAELIVRTPDAPRFAATFNAGPTTVTFSSA